jgi:GNAT superfamily N-acetyltransferase
MTVELVPVDERMLERLIVVAVTEAAADDVVPPLDDAGGWNENRLVWLRQYHRDCRAGLDGPAAQASFAVLDDGHVVGSARLALTANPRELETGMWLARSARGRGIGAEVLTAVAEIASSRADAVVLWLTEDQEEARCALQGAGADLGRPDADGILRATLRVAS